MKKRIEIMGVVNNGSKASRRMMGFDLDTNDFIHLASADKVRDEIRRYVRESKIMNGCDPERLTFLWDDFLAAWKDERAAIQKAKRAAKSAGRPATAAERLEALEQKRLELWEQFKADNARIREQIDQLRMVIERLERNR